MRSLFKKSYSLFGAALGVLGLVFVIWKISSYSDQIDISRFDISDGLFIAIASLVYCGSNLFLSNAWYELVKMQNVEIDRKWGFVTYGISQLSKYIPGNIFHLASRQTLGMSANINGTALAKSSIYELVLIAITASTFVILTTPLVSTFTSVTIPTISFFTVISIGLLLFTATNHKYLRNAFLSQLTFLFISGLLFVFIITITITHSISPSEIPSYVGAFVIAWLAGFLTPGSPAGIGVREFMLLFTMGTQIPEGDLLLAVVIGRLMTVIGDLLYFLLSLLFKIQYNIRY